MSERLAAEGVPRPYPFQGPQPAWWPLEPEVSYQVSWPTGAGGAAVGQHFVDTGEPAGGRSGEPLVFVHGNPTWSYYWTGLIRQLRHRFRCVAVDHVGCGWSDRPRGVTPRLSWHIDHLVRLLDTLDLKRVTMVVHDWGGAIGIGAALQRLNRVGRLVVFNTGAFPPPFIPFRIRVCRWPILGPAAILGANAFSRAALRMAVTDSRSLTQSQRAALLAPYDSWERRRGQLAFVRDIPLSQRHPTWAVLEKIERGLPQLADRPISLIWGMDDWCFRPSCLERFEQAWPKAEVHRLHGVGHYVVLEGASRVETLVSEFLERTTA